jgi:D-alanine-D-alanine ligase
MDKMHKKKKKLRVGVLFGGKSAEHEVSLLSAKNVIDAMDKNKYEPILIGIDKQGQWHLRDVNRFLHDDHHPKLVRLSKGVSEVVLPPKEGGRQLISLSSQKTAPFVDIVFPVLHGTYGEDGTMQGLLKLAHLPFVGASVLGSAVGMDKDVMKRLMRDAGIPIAKFITVHNHHKIDFDSVVKELGLPLFVKPANLGSSVGISKVKEKAEFDAALALAFQFDRKILIEEFIDAREIECSVIGNEHPLVSLPGEIIASSEFYSYDSKYVANCAAECKVPADLPKKKTVEIQALVAKTYTTLCCEGLARVDCFLRKNGDILINEINTIPGFTSTSAFPKLWAASGHNMTYIIDRLIEFAFERFEKEKNLKTSC